MPKPKKKTISELLKDRPVGEDLFPVDLICLEKVLA